MNLSLAVLENIFPLYLIIAIGAVGARLFEFDVKALARITIFLIVPVVFFGFTARVVITPDLLLVPMIIPFVGIAVTLLAHRLHQSIGLRDVRGNLSAMGIGTGNSGYFGVPLFAALFGTENLGSYLVVVAAYSIIECTAGYYVLSRGAFTVRESIHRLLRLPMLYAGAAGLLWSQTGLEFSAPFVTLFDWFKGSYSVLGMLIIGCTLGRMHRLELDGKFLAVTILGRHLVWPAILLPVMMVASPWLSAPMQQALVVLSVVPMAANLVAYANETGIHPEKAATAVILSTFLSAVVITAAAPLLFSIR